MPGFDVDAAGWLVEQEQVGVADQGATEDAAFSFVLPADAFGRSVSGFLRLSLSAPTARLAQALERIGRFAAGLNH